MKKIMLYVWNRFLLLSSKTDYSFEIVSSYPKKETIKAQNLVIVESEGFSKWALMRCPCGCNELLTLSLMKKIKPNWQYHLDKWQRITLSPSVFKNDGCRSHFFVIKGKIVWSRN